MAEFDNDVAIVTGAAGNLGVAVAAALGAAGARLVLVDRLDAAAVSARQTSAASARIVAVEGGADLTDPASAARAVARAEGAGGHLDIVVNTVGGFRGGRKVVEDDLATWDHLFSINLRTALNMARAALPGMIGRGRGRIVNIGAGAAVTGIGGLAAYGAAKSAVMRLTESLGAETKGTGVTVNAVLPSIIDTPENRADMPDADHRTWVSPAAIADVIVFLASSRSRAITGANIPVFGAD